MEKLKAYYNILSLFNEKNKIKIISGKITIKTQNNIIK